MSMMRCFLAYAKAFEQAFASDDWSVVEPFFTEDAVYETIAEPPFNGVHNGRAAIMAGFRQSVDTFDRRFDNRRVELVEGPAERDGAVWIRWRATYTVAGAPDLVLDGEERAWFDGDRICRLEDRFAPEAVMTTIRFMSEHEAKLKPGPSE